MGETKVSSEEIRQILELVYNGVNTKEKMSLPLNQIIHGDCLEVMKTLPDKSIDLVLTDPPYNIGKDFANDNLSLSDYIQWSEEWIKQATRVLRFGGAMWVTIGWQTVAEVKQIIEKQDDMRLKNWIIWYRQDGWKGDKGFSQSHEHILFFIKDNLTKETHQSFIHYLNEKRLEKELSLSEINKYFGWASNGGGCASSYMGDKEDNLLPTRKHYELLKEFLGLDSRFDSLPFGVKFNKCDVSDDVWLQPKSEKDRVGHPTQKPVPLMERIITVSSDEGDTILDPFGGSCTTGVACKQLKRNYICIEKEEKYVNICKERLEKTTTPMF